MNINKLVLLAVGLFVLFATTITYTWRWYEMATFGEVTPDIFHTWIAIILSMSLTLNAIYFYRRLKIKNSHDKKLLHYMLANYRIEITPIAKEDGGGFMAAHPELKGCMSDGETQLEAVANLFNAKYEWIKFCLEQGLEIPEASRDK
ncbi:type II toxin-antitoxin system HicB family antitoxin [Shouchella clausii]|uniref:type II toxin-antitoxin system HicB family antitoxin n=1 Tax=Shouchella clausii TaxID=79880 RepID=UPI001C733CAA|nr:type II toxin-antitoxin system HicB family antitoxin [Shouchella clausii]MBX0320284.1 type II toxin-antitoxin system HicB family antitoxin [Shouchella clausii]